MFYNLAPLQRKPSVSFSQGMCRHLAPGRAACAQDGPRQAALSGSSPGQMWHPGPTCANWHWPQESAPRWECPGLAPALGSAGKELLPEASRTFSRGLFASLRCLERLGLSCSLGRRVWAACSARPRDLCPKLCQPRLHSSSTFTTAVTQSLLNRGEQPHLAKLHWSVHGAPAQECSTCSGQCNSIVSSLAGLWTLIPWWGWVLLTFPSKTEGRG